MESLIGGLFSVTIRVNLYLSATGGCEQVRD